MNANAIHPLAKLSAAEQSLISSIDAAAARLDALGTSAVESALDRLRNAAHAAACRMADAGSLVASIAGDVLACALGEAMAVGMAMNADGAAFFVRPPHLPHPSPACHDALHPEGYPCRHQATTSNSSAADAAPTRAAIAAPGPSTPGRPTRP